MRIHSTNKQPWLQTQTKLLSTWSTAVKAQILLGLMGTSRVRCLQGGASFPKKSHRPSVSRRHGSFHPLKHKPRRERLPQYVHVMFSVHGLRGHGGPALFLTLFFTFLRGEGSPPSSGLLLLSWKETGKVSHRHAPRANLMPHAVRFNRQSCQFCRSTTKAAADLGAAS